MMPRKVLAVLCLLAAARAYAGVNNKFGWKLVSEDLDKESVMMKVTLPLVQSNLDLVEKLFWEVSTPGSAKYRQYLSHEEIGDLVRNPLAASNTVNFLTSAGVLPKHIQVDPHQTYVHAEMPISLAQQLFHAQFELYTHPQLPSHKAILKTESASLPTELVGQVSHLPHMTHFPEIKKRLAAAPPSKSDDDDDSPFVSLKDTVYPDVLRNHYGIDDPVVRHGATQAVFAAFQSFNPDDLNLFQGMFNVTTQAKVAVSGTNDPSDCTGFLYLENCDEATLDVQYITAVAQGASTIFWSIEDGDNLFLTWAEQASYTANPPMVMSISYGSSEAHWNSSDTDLFNTEVMKLGLRGVTVIASSGDSGVAFSSEYCDYGPTFPATSPYVTAVGASDGPQRNVDEIVCQKANGALITSGGGFSCTYPRPAYQESQVSTYLSTYLNASGFTPADWFCSTGRGYPDVSVLGRSYVIYISGTTTPVDGTSASAPVFAGMITLINDALLAQGKPTVGFLNPALYYAANHSADVFNDITSGNNTCDDLFGLSNIGFGASPYWDAASGLGSPHFQSLKRVLMDYEINVKPTQAPSVADSGLTPLPTTTSSPLPPPTVRVIWGPETDSPTWSYNQPPAVSSGGSGGSGGSSVVAIVAIIAAVIAVLGVAALVVIWNRRRRANNAFAP